MKIFNIVAVALGIMSATSEAVKLNDNTPNISRESTTAEQRRALIKGLFDAADTDHDGIISEK